MSLCFLDDNRIGTNIKSPPDHLGYKLNHFTPGMALSLMFAVGSSSSPMRGIMFRPFLAGSGSVKSKALPAFAIRSLPPIRKLKSQLQEFLSALVYLLCYLGPPPPPWSLRSDGQKLWGAPISRSISSSISWRVLIYPR